jgi:hypothetical protein
MDGGQMSPGSPVEGGQPAPPGRIPPYDDRAQEAHERTSEPVEGHSDTQSTEGEVDPQSDQGAGLGKVISDLRGSGGDK